MKGIWAGEKPASWVQAGILPKQTLINQRFNGDMKNQSNQASMHPGRTIAKLQHANSSI